MTTSRVRLPGSVRSSDRLPRKEGRAVSDKETPDSAVSGGGTRRDALVKAGVVAAGAVAAGAIAGTGRGGGRQKEKIFTSEGKHGGRDILGPRRGPRHRAPLAADP